MVDIVRLMRAVVTTATLPGWYILVIAGLIVLMMTFVNLVMLIGNSQRFLAVMGPEVLQRLA